MKRILITLLLVTTVVALGAQEAGPSALVPSEELQDAVSRYIYLDLLANQKAYESDSGREHMRQLSEGLPLFFKQTIYERYDKEPLAAAALNLFTGGVGSIIMGDWIAGSILTLGAAGATVGTVMMLSNAIKSEEIRTTIIIASIGVSVVGAGWPFLYAHFKNPKLTYALSMD